MWTSGGSRDARAGSGTRAAGPRRKAHGARRRRGRPVARPMAGRHMSGVTRVYRWQSSPRPRRSPHPHDCSAHDRSACDSHCAPEGACDQLDLTSQCRLERILHRLESVRCRNEWVQFCLPFSICLLAARVEHPRLPEGKAQTTCWHLFLANEEQCMIGEAVTTACCLLVLTLDVPEQADLGEVYIDTDEVTLALWVVVVVWSCACACV